MSFPTVCTFFSFLISSFSALPVLAQMENQLRINQIQVIGTHNSYHAGFAPSAARTVAGQQSGVFMGLDYQHQPLDQQFDGGVRQIELDVFRDSKGGLLRASVGRAMIAAAHLPADPEFRSRRRDEQAGLQSHAHAGHRLPQHLSAVYRLPCNKSGNGRMRIRTTSRSSSSWKQSKSSRAVLQLTVPEPFTSSTFDALDAEIRSVFPPDEIITPDDVRGHYDTLNQAVLAGNWPTLKSARGKVIFLMDQRPVGPVYLAGHPSLRGRVLFTNAEPGEPDAAFIERNDGPAADITALVQKGYLVRTRTDADTKEARTNDTARRDAMIASGAQILSTDYPGERAGALAGALRGYASRKRGCSL